MKDLKKINDQITVAGQPTSSYIEHLKNNGFRTIVNMRTYGEDEHPMSPATEKEIVDEAGMKYVHLPVSPSSMGPELVDKFRAQIAELPGPVLVHCAAGMRAGAFSMMATATKEGWTGDETLEKAKAMGFECKAPELKQFVRSYVDGHQPVKDAS